jgi:hypothetical protein
VSVVQEAVTDRVGQGGVGEVVVPLGGRELAGDDGGAGAVAVLEDLEEIAALRVLHGGEPPVVDHEDVEAGERAEQADVGAIGTGQGELVEEAGGPAVAGARALAARLMRQGAGEEALADAGGADQDHVVVLGDPAAGGELADDGLVELAPGRVVDGLDARLRELELGLLQGPYEARVLPGAPLGLDEEAEALVEGEGGEIGLLLLRGPGRGHGVELEGLELFHCRGGQHRWVSFTGSRPARGDGRGPG